MALHRLNCERITTGIQWKCKCGTETAGGYCKKKIRACAAAALLQKKWISQLSPPKVSGIFTRAGLVFGVQNSSSIIFPHENQVIW